MSTAPHHNVMRKRSLIKLKGRLTTATLSTYDIITSQQNKIKVQEKSSEN